MAEVTVDAARPRAVMRVGVTGHRRLDDVRGGLTERVRETLREIAEALVAAHAEQAACFAADPPLLRVISPLAEGADRLVAQVALDGQPALPIAVDLQCPLPFPVESYRLDFIEQSSKDAFDALLARATAIVELPGERRQPDAPEDAPDLQGAAYATVGEYVIDHSDLVLALWDGGPARGVGGTAEVVARARAQGVPVLHVDPTQPDAPARLLGSDAAPEPTDWRTSLRATILKLLLPPCASRLEIRTPGDTPPGVLHSNREQADEEALQRWLAEPSDTSQSFLGGLWRAFNALVGGGIPQGRPSEPLPQRVSTVMAPFEPPYDRANRLAMRYAGKYRGAFLANYLFGAAAVLIGLVTLLLAHGTSAIVLGTIELTLLASIVWNVFQGGSWHRRFLDYRLLAEQLRHTQFLHLLGRVVPGFRVPAHHAQDDPQWSWTSWVYRGVVREAGLPSVRPLAPSLVLDGSYAQEALRTIRDTWIGGQIDYHARAAASAERIAHRLERSIWLLALLTLALCAVHVGVEILGVAHAGKDMLPPLPVRWLYLGIIGLPAVLGALHGIRSHGEFVRLAERSRSMHFELTRLQQTLDTVFPKPGEAWSVAGIRDAVDATAQGMIDEAIDWRILARAQQVALT